MTKIGLIGAGRWSTPYALSAKAVGAEVVGIYTPNPSAAELSDRIQSNAIDDPRKVIELADVVLIGSPSDSHADYLAMANEAGKTALCASPVIVDPSHAEKIQGFKTVAFASFPLRARPEYRRLKDALAGGELGTPGIYRLGVCRPKPAGWRADTERSGGALMESGIHLVDALEWLGGPVQRIYGATNQRGDSQYYVLVAKMADGSIGHIEVSWAEADGVSYDYYEVAGSDGLLEYDSRKEPLMVVDYHDNGTDVLSPGATAAHHELSVLVSGKGNDELVSLADGVETCRKVKQIIAAIHADEVLMF